MPKSPSTTILQNARFTKLVKVYCGLSFRKTTIHAYPLLTATTLPRITVTKTQNYPSITKLRLVAVNRKFM
jgi:hypothetical protein